MISSQQQSFNNLASIDLNSSTGNFGNHSNNIPSQAFTNM